MVSVNSISAISTVVLLALLHRSAATCNQDVSEEEPVTASPIHANDSDVILLTSEEPMKEAHHTFARLLGRPIITWNFRDKYFIDHVSETFYRRKQLVFFAADPNVLRETPSKLNIRGVMWFSCSPSLFHCCWSRNRAFTVPPPGCKVAEYLTFNETAIRSIFRTRYSFTDVKRSFKGTLRKLRPFQRSCVEELESREVTVACIADEYNDGRSKNCGNPMHMEIIELLRRKNVTVRRKGYIDKNELDIGFWQYRFSMTLVHFYLHDDYISYADLPYISVFHDAFYSRVDTHRLVSLLEVAGECWKLVAATATVLAMVVFVYVVAGNKEGSISRGISDTTLFLVAAVLATSAALPEALGRVGIIRKALLGLWLATLLPLSVYFRSELTALITLRRPADHINTLQKLDDALDTRQVVPCLTGPTLELLQKRRFWDEKPQHVLMRRLYFSVRHEFINDTFSACLKCASQRNRVCYTYFGNSQSLTYGNVIPFSEHMNTWLEGFIMLKYHPLYKPLRRFFRDIEEHRLLDSHDAEHDNDSVETEFDISGPLMLLVIFHAASCLVLLLEVVIAHFFTEPVVRPGILRDNLSRLFQRRRVRST